MKYAIVCLLLVGSVFAAEDDDKKEDVGTVVGIDLGTTYSWYVKEGSCSNLSAGGGVTGFNGGCLEDLGAECGWNLVQNGKLVSIPN